MRKLRPYLLYLTPWWLLIPLVTVALYQSRIDTEHARRRLAQAEHIESAVHLLDVAIARLQRDVRLAGQSATSHLIRNDMAGLADFFQDFLTVNPRYAQARMLDTRCREVLRLDHGPGLPVRTPEVGLQDKSGRYYCTETLKLDPGRIYLSPLDLNIEHGHVVEPHEPTLRSAMRVLLPDGQTPGLVVLNFNAANILTAFARVSDIPLALLNENGDWLVGLQPGDAFGFALGAPERSFARQHPAAWAHIQHDQRSTDVINDGSQQWMYRRVTAPDDPEGNIYPEWYAVADLASDPGIAHERRLLFAHVMLGAAVLFSLSVISVLFARSDIRREALSTELGAINTRLTQSLAQLETSLDERVQSEKLASLGLLVAGVAHELNTPLGGAMLTGTRLREQMDELQAAYDAGLRQSDLIRHLENGREGTDLLNANLQRAARLITQFKAVASDRSCAERARFNLKNCVEDVLALMHGETKHRQITIDVRIPPAIELNSYPGPLGQVIQNLVMNSVRHAFAPNDDGLIVIEAQLEGEHVRLSVIDHGRGIDPAAAKRIWDPFYTTARHAGGTGLGLHLCQQLTTHVLGGELKLDAPPADGGTHMCMTIPLTAPDTSLPDDASTSA